MGMEQEAIEIYEQLVEEYSIPGYGFLPCTYIKSGKIKEGKKILHDLETNYDSIPTAFGALVRAQLYAALGDYENAYKWYAFEPHHHWIPWVRIRWTALTNDSTFIKNPGFKALMRRFNLRDPAPLQNDPDLDR